MFPEVQAGDAGVGGEGDGKQVGILGPGRMRTGKVEESRRGSQGLEVKLPPLPQNRGTKPGRPRIVGQLERMKPSDVAAPLAHRWKGDKGK